MRMPTQLRMLTEKMSVIHVMWSSTNDGIYSNYARHSGFFYHMLPCALISDDQACSSLVQNRRCGIVSLKSWSKCPTTSIMRRHSGRMKCIKYQQFRAAQDQTSYYSLKPHAINDNQPLFLLLHEDRKSTRLNSSHSGESRMPSSA